MHPPRDREEPVQGVLDGMAQLDGPEAPVLGANVSGVPTKRQRLEDAAIQRVMRILRY